jgi:hypothetical protein
VPAGLASGAEVLDELLVAQPLEAVRGKLTEDSDSIKPIKSTKLVESWSALGATVASHLNAGDTVTIAREAIHRVRHAGIAPAVTLHAYSPPLSRVGTYEVDGDGSLLRHPLPPDLPLEAAA